MGRTGAGVLVAVLAALNAVVAVRVLTWPPINTDFLAFWSFPRLAAAQGVAALYRAPALAAFQHRLYPGFGSFYPFLYPPSFLLVTWWLRDLGFETARLLWTVLGLGMLAAGARFWFGRRFGPALAVILASPAALISVSTGETGFFTTGLLLLGLAWRAEQPWAAGIAFGLLALKPQLALLLPFALAGERAWRVLAAMAATMLAGFALSTALWGIAPWVSWTPALAAAQQNYFSGRGLNLNILVTPVADLLALGVALRAAWAAQLAVSAALAGAIFVLFRRRAPLAVPALIGGACLAAPHAYAYDTVALAAVLPMLGGLAPAWLAALLYVSPLLLLTRWAPAFLYAVPEALLVSRIVLASWPPGAAQSGHEPDLPARRAG